MDSLLEFIQQYDWQLTVKLFFCIVVIVYLFLENRLRNFFEYILVSPFLIMMSLFLSVSDNLISIILYIELSLFLKDILYNINVNRFESFYFRMIRLPLWVFAIYCYYTTFSTFEILDVANVTGSNLTILFFSVLTILSSIIIGFLYRKKYLLNSKFEKITVVSILYPAISFKLISLLAKWSDLLLPTHKMYMYNLILVLCVLALILSIRYIYVRERDDIFLAFSSMVPISLYPLIIYINNEYWQNFEMVSLKLIALISVSHLFYLNTINNRFSQVTLMILSCEIFGISPFGHLVSYFGDYSKNTDQLFALSSLLICFISISIVFKSMVNSLNKEV
jgi:hypothetical protein